MKRQLLWKACADDAWRIERLATSLLARLTYNDNANPSEIERVRKVGAYALWLRRRYEALSKELD